MVKLFQQDEARWLSGENPWGGGGFESAMGNEFWMYRMYAEIGDSAAAWTAGNGGNDDSGAIGRPVRPKFRAVEGWKWELFGSCCGGGRLVT